jgi:nucleotide-binding universal stress UspA family protein
MQILIPTDFSDCSRKALGLGLSMASRFGAKVWLLHVEGDNPSNATYWSNEATNAELAELESAEAAVFAEFEMANVQMANTTGLKMVDKDDVAIRVATGAPAEEFLRAAGDCNADLIIMGTHGRTGIRDFFVGSTTERVVERASAAVFAVKPDGYPFLRD